MINAPQNLTYEEASKRLEEVVLRLERGDLTLEEALASFEEAVGLVSYCKRMLSSAEQRLALLLEQESGEFELKPLSFPEET
jgi:exodeoxyribonuclease VII small subunit